MPTKAEMYAQMAEQVAAKLTDSWQEWTGFLTTAARLYKYTFQDQMMIYAQRPDAPGSDDDLCPEAGRHRLCRV